MTALTILAAIYFVPTIVAGARSHRQMGPIIALNALLGWTVIGWAGALVWALTSDVKAPAATVAAVAATTRPCPYCAEAIKREAIVCRFCGRDIDPLPAVNPFERLPSYRAPDAPQARTKPLTFG